MTRARQPFETLEARGSPTVRQLSVFLENRVGQLLRLTRLFEDRPVRIMALAVVDSADYAVARLLFDAPDEAAKVLHDEGFAFSVTELVVVRLPHGPRALLEVFSALLSAEVNIGYAYPLLPGHEGPAIALSVDSLEGAIETLERKKFAILSEADLQRS